MLLAADESKEVPITIDSDSGGLQHSVIVKSDRLSGEVQSKLVSRSDGRLFEVEILGRDEKASDNAGGHPWIVQDGTESHLLLFNHTASAMTFGVSISNGLQIWNKRYHVAPFATRQLSINQIIGDEVKDDNGQTLDARFHDGVVAWSTANAGEAKGRLLVSNRATAMARTFSCYTTQVVCAINVSVYDYGLVPIDNYTDYADAVPAYCYPPQQGSCRGTQASGGGATFGWTLGNTNIVNFNTAGDQSRQNPNLRGIAAGTTSAYVTAYLNGCQAGGSGSPSPAVQKPTSLRVVQTLVNQARSCPKGQAGWWRQVSRIVEDQNVHDIDVENQTVNETVTVNAGQNGLNVGTIATHPGVTQANFQYPDGFYVCSPLCPGTGTTTATQTNTDTFYGESTAYPLTNSTIQYSCSSVAINGSLKP